MRNLFRDRSFGRPALAGASLAIASLLATTAPALAQSNRSIINGGFEQPDVGLNTVAFFDESAVPGWETTATDNQMELWGSGFENVPAFEGDQFVELNAFQAATLFQPLCLVPGDAVNWSFAHHGRLGADTLRLTIGTDVITTVTTGTAAWSVNSGTYTPTLTASAPVDFFFESVDAAGGSAAGNLLDAVEIVLPPHYELSAATGSGVEAAGDGLPVLLVSGTLTAPGSVDVVLSGTATQGTDYTATATITIPAGEYDGTVATGIPLGISITDEAAPEADETIIITIANATGENEGNPARIADVDCNNTALAAATYTISNDDADPICGNGSIEGSEGCDDGNTTAADGCSSTCTVEVDYICTRADFSLVSEETIAGGEGAVPDWDLSEDGFTVFQGVNSDPGVYLSSLPAQGIGEIEFSIAVETTSDDDFVGVVLGFDTGELTAADASYLLIDWKQLDQQSGANLGEAGLAVSLVTGATNGDDLWGHTGTVRELAEATTLGATGWNDNEVYTWTLDYTATRLILSVNGTVELDLLAADVGLDAFPAGNVGFYNYSQSAVRYTLLSPRGRSVCQYDPGVCVGHDDSLDADADGVPDGCDVCAGSDDGVDADGDGAPDGCDVCTGSDDGVDADSDGVPDGCDVCAGSDDSMDTDTDGVPNGCDVCAGDDGADADNDGTPDACDTCAAGDDGADADSDGTPDACDLCAMDAENDADGDGICEIEDNCPLRDNPDQADGDADGVGDACSPRYGLQGGGCSATSGAAGGWNALLVLLALLLIHGWRRRAPRAA